MGRGEYPDYLHESEQNPCKHEWWVFGRAEQDRTVLVECWECHELGTVDNPTPQEWIIADWAESDMGNYRWPDPSRVVVREARKF